LFDQGKKTKKEDEKENEKKRRQNNPFLPPLLFLSSMAKDRAHQESRIGRGPR